MNSLKAPLVKSRLVFAFIATLLGTTTATVATAQTSSTVTATYRTFIPAEAVNVPFYPTDFINNGDNRAFSRTEGTEKSLQSAFLNFDPNGELIGFGSGRDTDETRLYNKDQGFEIGPSWRWGLRDGAQPVRAATLDINNVNLPVISNLGNAASIRFELDAGNPVPPPLFNLLPPPPVFTPGIGGDFNLLISRNPSGTINYELEGSHDGFPAHELYINDNLIYAFDPLLANSDPTDLVPGNEVQVPRITGTVDSPLAITPPFPNRSGLVFGDAEGTFGPLIPTSVSLPDFEPDIPSFVEGVGTNELNFGGDIPSPINSIAFNGGLYQTEPEDRFVLGTLTYTNGLLSSEDPLVSDLTISTSSPFRDNQLWNESYIEQLVIGEDSIRFELPENFRPDFTVDIFTVPEGQTGVIEVLGQFVDGENIVIGLGRVLSGPGTGSIFRSGIGGELPTPVPESSSVVGIISFGVLSGGLLLKRRQHRF
jgi:hypothetical protein